MSRFDPKNREEAYVYQFEDDVSILRSMCALGNKEGFEQRLELLRAHIVAYFNEELRKSCEDARIKHEKTGAWLELFMNGKTTE
mgnify:CR=1 FL=1